MDIFNESLSLNDSFSSGDDVIISRPQKRIFPAFHPSEAVVSNEEALRLQYVVDVWLTAIASYVGIVGNCINIAVFYREGYKETINISLTAIAFWDLIKSLCGASIRWYALLEQIDPVLSLGFITYVSLIPGYTSTFCTYVSSALAAYVAVERCLCVSLPFTVKYLLTPKLVTSVMTFLSIFIFGSFSVIYLIQTPEMVFVEAVNATVPYLVYSDFHKKYPEVLTYFNIIGFIWPSLSLAVISVCTWIIAYHLRKSRQFRSGTASGSTKEEGKGKDKGMSGRERKVIKMLLVIIIVYIVNIFPRVVIAIAKTAIPGFYLHMYYHNLFLSCMFVEFFFDHVNAAINPFIYYCMSSSYKNTFNQMFGCVKKA